MLKRLVHIATIRLLKVKIYPPSKECQKPLLCSQQPTVALIHCQTDSKKNLILNSRSTLTVSSPHNFRPPDRASRCAHLSNDLVSLPNDSSHMTDTLSSPFQIASNENGAVQSEDRPAMQLHKFDDMELDTKAPQEFRSGINYRTWEMRIPKNLEKNLTHCHFVYHKYHVKWLEREPGTPR
jgi:hypothetical protein